MVWSNQETVCGLLDSIKGKLDDQGGSDMGGFAGQIMGYINDPAGRLCAWGYPRIESYGVRLPADYDGPVPAPLELMDVVAEDTDLLEQICSQEQAEQLREAVEQVLSPQERQVIVLRYGLDGQSPKRQREVAGLTGISRSYVSRIEKRALEKLRQALEE